VTGLAVELDEQGKGLVDWERIESRDDNMEKSAIIERLMFSKTKGKKLWH